MSNTNIELISDLCDWASALRGATKRVKSSDARVFLTAVWSGLVVAQRFALTGEPYYGTLRGVYHHLRNLETAALDARFGSTLYEAHEATLVAFSIVGNILDGPGTISLRRIMEDS